MTLVSFLLFCFFDSESKHNLFGSFPISFYFDESYGCICCSHVKNNLEFSIPESLVSLQLSRYITLETSFVMEWRRNRLLSPGVVFGWIVYCSGRKWSTWCSSIPMWWKRCYLDWTFHQVASRFLCSLRSKTQTLSVLSDPLRSDVGFKETSIGALSEVAISSRENRHFDCNPFFVGCSIMMSFLSKPSPFFVRFVRTMVWVWNVHDIHHRPLSLAIYTKWSEFSIVEDVMVSIRRSNVRIVLYIIDDRHPISANDNCIYHDYVLILSIQW